MPTQPPANTTDTVDVDFHFPVENDVIISVKAFNVPFKEGSYVIASDTMTKLADEFLKKLNTYGKLIDPKRGSEIVSRSILITVKDSKGPPKATYNPLKVGILLLIDQAPATSTDDGTKPADDGDAIKASGDTTKASSDATAANAVAISFEDHVADKRIDPTLVPATFARGHRWQMFQHPRF